MLRIITSAPKRPYSKNSHIAHTPKLLNTLTVRFALLSSIST